MKDLAAELIRRIIAFDARCYILQHTNHSEAWELLNYIRHRLESLEENWLTAEQIEDLVDSIQSLLLADPGFLRDVCLTYAKTFSVADYNGWFGKE